MGQHETDNRPENSVAYYAELLPRISHITLTISPLVAVPSHLTRISSSKIYMKITPDSAASILTLPGRAAKDVPISLQQLCELNSNKKDGSLRVKAEREARAEHITPLSAKQLSDSKSVQCNECGAVLVKENMKYLDLPSENWYELMDYWHCHKPNHHHGNESENAVTKDALKPRKSLALVGLTHVMVVNDDIVSESIKVSDTQYKTVVCSKCSSDVGILDHLDQSIVKIYKWNTIVESTTINNEIASFRYSPEIFVAEILLEVIEFHSTHHFGIAAHSDGEAILIYLWVFNSDISYTSNFQPEPTRAMKVLYTKQPDVRNQEIATEIIDLPLSAANNIVKVLETRSEELPDSLRGFGKWNVSLLHRL
ncbi:ubiquitin-conjugating enzyme E2-binding protein [Lipomyces chichibuensis]|uniref:ubiquitin-conjugating enzyme E2-binding protein n=1 Tax=Lipomyces chichibuensis TaxID=1546026 RepID=UPI00334394F5